MTAAAHVCDAGHAGCFFNHNAIERSRALYDSIASELRALLPAGTYVNVVDAGHAGDYLEIELSDRAYIASDINGTFEIGRVVICEPGVHDCCDYELTSGRSACVTGVCEESTLTDEHSARSIALFLASYVTR